MDVFGFLSVVFLFVLCYTFYIAKTDYVGVEGVAKDSKKYSDKVVIALLVLVGVLIRIGFAISKDAKATDIGNFQWLCNTILTNGIEGVYESGVSINFPPLVLYIFALVSGFCKLIGVSVSSNLAVLFIKLPALICDILMAVVIYKFAVKRMEQRGAFFFGVTSLLSPALLFDSMIWGQIDSAFVLCAVLMCIYLTEDKLEFAIIAFALGCLCNPLMLIFTVVIVVGLIDGLFLNHNDSKRIGKILLYLAAAMAGFVLLCLPCGLANVKNGVLDTYKALPNVTINAYNYWAMIGKNWAQEAVTTAFGMNSHVFGFVAAAIFSAIGVFVHYRTRHTKASYINLAVIVSFANFMFVTRMHERYFVATTVICLLAFVIQPIINHMLVYAAAAISCAMNIAFVMYVYKPDQFNPKETAGCITATVAFIAFLVVVAYQIFFASRVGQETIKNLLAKMEQTKKKPVNTETEVIVETTERAPKWTKFDYIAMISIMVVYSLFALHDIGNHYAPETFWEYNGTNSNQITLDMGEKVTVQRIQFYLGYYEKRNFDVEYADDLNGPWNKLQELEMTSVFCWGDNYVNGTPNPFEGRYVRLTSKDDKAVVFELVLKDPQGQILTPVNAGDYKELFDEQEMCPDRSTFRDSTYFDEIYHARTAYEFIHGLTTYEWTHPPLGKIFISIGVRIFGMNPFGWRIVGILFGIAMLPFFYAFARRFFKKTSFATVATILFAFDFMHFAQTRIATIDTYVTFFIILSYYFMYQYYKTSFYDTKLSKTFIPLGLCGIFMGFGMASKWTGIYAGAGLAVIFFITIFKRIREYMYAKTNIGGTTNGISHQTIVNSCVKNIIATFAFCIVFFIIIPLIIYTLSYIPFKHYNTGLIDEVIRNQTDILSYHEGVTSPHPFQSNWYQWPIMYRPIWYYSGHVTDTISEGISSFGNPAVWWAGIGAFVFLLYRSFTKKDKKALFLVISYLSQYLPWIFIGRTVFIYHYFTSVPFVVLMVAYTMYILVKEYKVPMPVIFAYTGLAVVLFLMFYPVLSGQPVNKEYVFHWLKWFDSWVLVT